MNCLMNIVEPWGTDFQKTQCYRLLSSSKNIWDLNNLPLSLTQIWIQPFFGPQKSGNSGQKSSNLIRPSICCVFWPAFRCLQHLKAGWTTFFSRFQPFLFILILCSILFLLLLNLMLYLSSCLDCHFLGDKHLKNCGPCLIRGPN